MSTTTKLTTDAYDQMVAAGILPETNRLELIDGRIVEKDVKNPTHSAVVELCRAAIAELLPAGWIIRSEQPVRIPSRDSEPEPDISVVRGRIKDYLEAPPRPRRCRPRRRGDPLHSGQGSAGGNPLAGSGSRLRGWGNPRLLDHQPGSSQAGSLFQPGSRPLSRPQDSGAQGLG